MMRIGKPTKPSVISLDDSFLYKKLMSIIEDVCSHVFSLSSKELINVDSKLISSFKNSSKFNKTEDTSKKEIEDDDSYSDIAAMFRKIYS